MGFVGDGGNITIATALPQSFCELYHKHQIVYEFLYLTFYACLKLRLLEVKSIPGPRRPVPAVYRLLCSNVRGLALTVESFRYDILLCSETLVSDMHRRFPDLVALSCCAGAGWLGPEGWWLRYEMDMEHFANPSLSVVVAKC